MRATDNITQKQSKESKVKIKEYIDPILLSIASIILLAYSLQIELTSFKGFLVDDAYISLRYAKNLFDGYGLNFNTDGGRVEGYTNFLYTILMAISFFLKINPEAWIKSIGLASYIGITFSLYLALKRRIGILPAAVVALAVAVDSQLAAFSLWGLEISLYPLICLLAILFTLDKEYLLSGIVISMAAMTRIEASAVILGPVIVFMLIDNMIQGKSKRDTLKTLGELLTPFLAIFLTYFIIRWMYYGYPLPNTFYAKVDVAGGGIARGIDYIARESKSSGIAYFFIPASFLLVANLITRRLVSKKKILDLLNENRDLALFFMVSITAITYVIYVGGDHFGARFLYHYYPIFLFFSILSFNSIGFTFKGFRIGATLGAILVFTATLIAHNAPNDFQFRGVEGWAHLGKYLREKSKESQVLAIGAAGAAPYYSELPTLDTLGLNDTHIAHTKPKNFGKGTPGHEKQDLDYVLNKKPDYIADWTNDSGKPLLGFNNRFDFWSMYSPLALVDMHSDYAKNRVVEVSNMKDLAELIHVKMPRGVNSYVLFKREIKPSPVKWPACQLPTQIGVKADNCSYSSDGKTGVLIHGPYIVFSEGDYIISVDYQKKSKGLVKFDIVSSRLGAENFTHAESILPNASPRSAYRLPLKVDALSSGKVYEFRIIADPDSDLTVYSVEAQRIN